MIASIFLVKANRDQPTNMETILPHCWKPQKLPKYEACKSLLIEMKYLRSHSHASRKSDVLMKGIAICN